MGIGRALKLTFVGERVELAHVTENPRPCRRVLVTADEREITTFYAPVDRWSESDYEQQWRDVFIRVRAGAIQGCFVIGAYLREIGYLVYGLGLWVREDCVKLNELAIPQEDLAPQDERALIDDPAQAFRWVPAFSEWCEDTNSAISHWAVSRDSVFAEDR